MHSKKSAQFIDLNASTELAGELCRSNNRNKLTLSVCFSSTNANIHVLLGSIGP